MALAEKGHANNVHYLHSDVHRENQDDSQEQEDAAGIYGKIKERKTESYLYTMGKAMGKTRGNPSSSAFNLVD